MFSSIKQRLMSLRDVYLWLNYFKMVLNIRRNVNNDAVKWVCCAVYCSSIQKWRCAWSISMMSSSGQSQNMRNDVWLDCKTAHVSRQPIISYLISPESGKPLDIGSMRTYFILSEAGQLLRFKRRRSQKNRQSNVWAHWNWPKEKYFNQKLHIYPSN